MTDSQSNQNSEHDFVTPNEQTRIEHGSHVRLHFRVGLENGQEIDSTFEREQPVELTIGDGNLLAGFEQVLDGLRAGDKRTAYLSPDEAFGEWNPDNVQRFDKNLFANSDHPHTPGMMMEFEDKGKNTLPGVIKEITSNEIVVDFNHPLAGQTVIFYVEIHKVTPKGLQGVTLS